MPRPRSVAVSVTAWTVGAVASVAIGLVALTMIGTGMGDGPLQPLAPNALNQPVGGVPPGPTDSPSSTPTVVPGQGSIGASPQPTGERTVTTGGGSVFVRCAQSQAYLRAWIPAPGFRADDVLRGPAQVVSITFESSVHEVTVTATCAGTVAAPTVSEGDHGGDDHGGHG